MRTRWLCLEFTRTVGWEPADRQDDALVSYEALLAWSEREGALTEAEAEALRALAAAEPVAARQVLANARALRRASYVVFAAVGAGRRPGAAEVDALNEWLPHALRHLRLEPTPDGAYRWGWREGHGAEALGRPLWPVAQSAAELLMSPELVRLKVCEADDCGWLFVDASRNRSRRWCDMSDCGNLAKVRRFRARRRGLA